MKNAFLHKKITLRPPLQSEINDNKWTLPLLGHKHKSNKVVIIGTTDQNRF